ncbi:hypothetical protein MMC20_001036 [Loxospora ochrophaea]|nr:hypothetical protein [Loxospora ochrophaea]
MSRSTADNAAETMHDGGDAHNLQNMTDFNICSAGNNPTADTGKLPPSPVPTAHPSSLSPDSTSNAPQHDKYPHHEPDSARHASRAALRQLSKSARRPRGSTTSTQPVLVRPYSGDMSPVSPRKPPPRKLSRRDLESIDLPPLSAFSFQDILASVDPEIRGAIDNIAEICGRSKMSLANEYGSHLPPQGELSLSRPDESIDAVQNMLHQSLEPVEESSSSRRESTSSVKAWVENHSHRPQTVAWALLSASPADANVTSVPISQTSDVTSHVYNAGSMSPRTTTSRARNIPTDLLPNMVAWIQHFQAFGSSVNSPRQTGEALSAADALKGSLKS